MYSFSFAYARACRQIAIAGPVLSTFRSNQSKGVPSNEI